MRRALMLICGVILFTACDDGPKVHPDADGDVDAPDVVDVQDADADMDVPDWPECTPWISEQNLPEGSLVELPLPDPNGEGDLYPNSIFGNLMVLAQGYDLFLINLETFDATSIVPSYSPFEFGFDRYVTYNKNIALKGNKCELVEQECVFFDMGIYIYYVSSGEWEYQIDVPIVYSNEELMSYIYVAKPETEYVAYVLFDKFPESGGAGCSLFVNYLSTHEEHLVANKEQYHTCGNSFLPSGPEVAFCGVNTQGTGLGLYLFNTEARTQVELDTVPAGHCGVVSFLDENQVLFETSRTIRGRYQGEIVEAVDYDVTSWNRQANALVPLSDDPWWSQLNLLSKPPLAVYRDHRVFCFGYPEAGVNASDAAYLVLHDLETGVKRPIPYPTSPMDSSHLHVTVPLGILETPWRLVFGDYGSYHDDPSFSVPAPPIFILNLELAGLVDEAGHVIPDPTYPPTPAN